MTYLLMLALHLAAPSTTNLTAVHCHPVACVQHRLTVTRPVVTVETRTRPTNTRDAYTVAPWTSWHVTRTYRLTR